MHCFYTIVAMLCLAAMVAQGLPKDGPTYVRIDASNLPDFWDTVVDSDAGEVVDKVEKDA